ncbi:formimidoylglutamase [Nocardia amikacinitolerans]|uniref:formimidoylglutamase n=1 Tax=Nocardia amikacinitolerans TaxID=756689 RepID=UPI0020A26B4F|nr:formimidoylglutamase [Nocardia amikacinitolerans]MCP2292000.1 formiminoglutamase [Nocardia amikacinitolerans]
MNVDIAPRPWTGRVDGDAPEHARWHQLVRPYDPTRAAGKGCVLIGFASDEGVRRNKGRPGAAAGPDALRGALSSLALPEPLDLEDAGTIVVGGTDLESGQRRLGRAVAATLDAGRFPVVLGGGHEVAFGTYSGIAAARRRAELRLGILNLDAHFDLRADDGPSSGTPFRQIAEAESAAGRSYRYDVLGISQPSNTVALFETARELGVHYLTDERCGVVDRPTVDEFVDTFLNDVDLVYLTLDLDVLPAAVAPGVSAPAGYGVPVETVQRVCDRVTASGKLVAADVAELAPVFDIDARTARTAARLIHRMVVGHRPVS